MLEKLYRKTLIGLLGLTKAISCTEKNIPGRWHEVMDSVRASSTVLHVQLSVIDAEVTREYLELEDNFSKKIGNRKLYTDEDLENARKRIEQVEF